MSASTSAAGRVGGDLTARLAADRAGGSRHQDAPAANQPVELVRVEEHLVARQQVVGREVGEGGDLHAVVQVGEGDRQDLVAELEVGAGGQDLAHARGRQPRDREEELLHLAALRDRGQPVDRPEDRTAPDPLAPLPRVVVHEADHLVRVLVGAPQVPEKEIAGRARAHDQRAHARGRARAALGQEPVVREPRREAEGADEARRQEELHRRAPSGAGRGSGGSRRRPRSRRCRPPSPSRPAWPRRSPRGGRTSGAGRRRGAARAGSRGRAAGSAGRSARSRAGSGPRSAGRARRRRTPRSAARRGPG